MVNIDLVSQFGGVFALLVFWHFVVDWVFQSHDEAVRKSGNPTVRGIHCTVYTLGFVPLMYLFGLTFMEALVSMVLLFVSHFIEDTYVPVMLWAKHMRQHPAFRNGVPDNEAFAEFVSSSLGRVLAITIDQLIHLFFLFPLAYYAIR